MIYYYISKAHRKLFKPQKLDVKNICVGNFSFGGTGKTPFTIYLANKFKEKFNSEIVIVSSGYKRKFKDIEIVGNAKVDVERVGDEPYLIYLKTLLKVVVYEDRLLASKIALELFNPQLIIYDDALQYWKIDYDYRIGLVDYYDIKNWRVFPFGLYREPLKEIKRIDLVVLNFKFKDFEDIRDFAGKPTLLVAYKPLGFFSRYKFNKLYDFREVVAFCGIADSRSFIETLKSLGLKVIYFKKFPDHHFYKDYDLKKFYDFRLPIITTLKDWVKLKDKDNIYYFDFEVISNDDILKYIPF